MFQNARTRIKNWRFYKNCMPVVFGPNGISFSHKQGVKIDENKHNSQKLNRVYIYYTDTDIQQVKWNL